MGRGAWNAFSSIRGFVSLVICLNIAKAVKIKNRAVSPALNFENPRSYEISRGGGLESVSVLCPRVLFKWHTWGKRKHICVLRWKAIFWLDWFPQLAEHGTVVIYDENPAFTNNFLLMNIFVRWDPNQDEQSVVRREMFLRDSVSLHRRKSLCLVWFWWPSPPPGRKLREHHKGLLFSGILKFSIHASKQFRGRKSFLVVQSWTGKLEASVKI